MMRAGFSMATTYTMIFLLTDAQDFEDECLKPGHSERLSQMGLALLKQVSSHKGLTYASSFLTCAQA
jgi:hypothetical protein